MTLPLTQVVGYKQRTADGEDAHGNPVVAFADAVPVKVYGYGPSTSGEPFQQGRDVVVTGQTVYAPSPMANAATGEPVTPTALDRFELPLGGPEYEVDGEIGDWNHGPFGWAPGYSIALKRVEG